MRQIQVFIILSLFSSIMFGQVRQETVSIPFSDYIKNPDTHVRNEFILPLTLSGTEYTFKATPNDVMEEDLKREYPSLRTYDLTSDENKETYGALTVTDYGIYVTLHHFLGTSIFIRPSDYSGSQKHTVEYGISKEKARCGHIEHQEDEKVDLSYLIDDRKGLRNTFELGTTRYRYDVAIICTGEYYINNGNTNSSVTSSITQTVNNISAIYKKDLSITLSTSSSRIKLYSDPNTDPFIPDNLGGDVRTIQAGREIKASFADNVYDIGHVFHQHADGDGWGNGGLAQLECVCDNSVSSGVISKGSGWSGAYTNSDLGWVLLAAHEFGHQFGAKHTFNGLGNSCTSAISLTTAYEIGSGTTIMSYEGLCNDDNNVTPNGLNNDYFHIISIQQMMNYIVNDIGNTCATKSASNNAIPEVTASPCSAKYQIPKNTPFYFKGSASDADNDPMTYNWEEIDEDGPNKPTQGYVGTQAAGSAIAPLFRSYQPNASTERYFPSLEVLKNGGSDFEVLPTVPRTLNFAFVARDNNSLGSALASDNVSIQVVNSGPFEITKPNGGETLTAGKAETITWNTNNSNNLCDNVRIKLSVDDGLTFDVVLAENIPYSAGTATVTLPPNFFKTSSARVMIECMDYDCFKIFTTSTNNFNVSSTCDPQNSVLCSTAKVTMFEGDPGTITGLTKTIANDKIERTITSGSSLGRVVVLAETGSGCKDFSNYYTVPVTIYATETGKYQINATGSGFLSLFRAGYKPADGCSKFLNSTRRALDEMHMTGENQTFEVNLSACTDYVVVFYSFYTLPAEVQMKVIGGPGLIVEKSTLQGNGYVNKFIVVNQATGLIYSIMDNPDVSGIPVGNYTIYSIVMSDMDTTPFIGTSFANFVAQECVNVSYNSKELEVLPNCTISGISAGAQTPCIPGNNTFTQTLTITYDKAPTTGKLSVNGQLFDITGSPQTVILNNLDSDGSTQDVSVFFTDQPTCKLDRSAVFISPVNCCPVQVELGADINKCVGDMVTLDAGSSGTNYIWKRDGQLLSSNARTITVSTDGKYFVDVIHSSGCQKSDSITVTFHALPLINLPSTTAFCENESTVILATLDNPGYTIKWYKDGVVISGQTTNSLTVDKIGTYKIEATNQYGCSDFKEIVVTQITTPTVELGDQINQCEGDPLTLDAGANGNNYIWRKDGVVLSDHTQTLNVTESGTYSVFVEFGNNCAAEDDVIVRIFESPVLQDLPPMVDICNGEKATLQAVGSGYTSLQWYFNGNPINNATNSNLEVGISGEYSVTVKNDGGCAVTKSSVLDTHSAPTVELGQDIVACIGPDVTLFAGNEGTTYYWTKNGQNINQSGNTIMVNTNGQYAVTVTNDFGCKSTDQIMVTFVTGPSLDLGSDITICQGETATIKAQTNTPTASIIWNKNGLVIPNQNSFNLQVTEAGEYEAVVFGGVPPCEVRKSIVVNVNPKPGINLGVDKSICDGDPFPIFDAGAGHTSYAWALNGVPAGNTQTIQANQSGIYSATVTNNFNCSNSDNVKLTINPLPTLTLPSTFDLCKGDTLMVTPTTNAVSFTWAKNGTVITGATQGSLQLTSAGTYAVTVSSAAKCVQNTTFVVTERNLPVVDLGKDTLLCPGQSLVINAGQFSKYLWSDGTTGSSITVNSTLQTETSKVYGVQVSNQYNCQAQDSIQVTVRPKVTAAIKADNVGVCNGEPVILEASGGLFYSWTDPDNTLSSTNTATTIAMPTVTTTYTVQVSDDCPGNTANSSYKVNVFEPQNISAGKDTCLILGTTIELKASGGVSYEWGPISGIVGSSSNANPEISITEPTTFVVTITDTNGCMFSDSVYVCVEEDPLKFFKAVTMITPNGDGANDVLTFRGLEYYPDNTLTIFNRWGNIIFEAYGYQSPGALLFDGTKNGKPLPADTYYYILQFDNKVYKNPLTILRD
ncbi:MAG: gliding motility-associated C-terminal domain-containing protein [Lewinellaceae bacterium]|nr:gliding motility-associated C-terminal domain-containing protein [Lewinellaceae bacterium]